MASKLAVLALNVTFGDKWRCSVIAKCRTPATNWLIGLAFRAAEDARRSYSPRPSPLAAVQLMSADNG
jgi:hypothetical protein